MFHRCIFPHGGGVIASRMNCLNYILVYFCDEEELLGSVVSRQYLAAHLVVGGVIRILKCGVCILKKY